MNLRVKHQLFIINVGFNLDRIMYAAYTNIILLPNCTMLYYVFSGPLSLRAYVPEINFHNNCQCLHHIE